jgi:nucleotide-binding universal stress UspA family protein
MYRKIMVAYNGTTESRSALDECIALAPGPSAEIHLLAVMPPRLDMLVVEYAAATAMLDQQEATAETEKMEHELAAGNAILTSARLKVINHLESGDPVSVIAELADRLGVQLVIVGHPRHKPWGTRWWRGSTDAALIEKVHCSVLVASAPRT